MFGLGTTELIIIAVTIIFLFGAKRIPEIGRGVGESLKEFKKVKKDLNSLERESDVKQADAADSDIPLPGRTITDRVIDQVPIVKKAKDINRKVNNVKKIIT